MPNLPNDRGATPRARQLAKIVEMLSHDPAVRGELVDDLRAQVARGEYVTEAKLDLAIHRMLKDILR